MAKNNKEKSDLMYAIRKEKLFTRLLILCAAQFVSACTFNLFLLPNNIVSGGVSGLSIITENLFNIEPTLIILIVSVSLLILSFLFLGFEKTSASIVATFIFPFFVSLTENIGSYLTVNTSDLLLVAIFVGVVSGFTSGINYKMGFSNGGLGIISQLLYKYFKISLTTSSLWVNGIVVVCGGFCFGWTKVMYAIIVLYISNIIADKVLIGISKNKSLYIMTRKEQEVKEYIMNTLHHGVTEFNVKGGFELNKKHALMTVIPNNDYFRLKEGVNLIDNEAFFIVTDSYQVYGGE